MITSHLNGLKQTSKVDFKLKKTKIYTLSTSLRPVRMFDPKFGFISYTFWRHSGNENSKKKNTISRDEDTRAFEPYCLFIYFYILFAQKPKANVCVCTFYPAS